MALEILLQSLLQQYVNKGSRSTALHSLTVPCLVLAAILIAAFRYKSPPWVVISIFGLFICIFVIFSVGFLYFMIRNPDALRSENFTLEKTRIEQSMTGDNRSGFAERMLNASSAKAIPSQGQDEMLELGGDQ